MMTIKEIISLQKELSSFIGVSGFEDDVRDFLIEQITPLVDKVTKDTMGNVLAIKKGSNPEAHRILLDAHMDEVGFMINHIEPDGYLRFVMIGGWDTRTLLSQAVVIKSKTGKIYNGIIGSKPPHILTAEERKYLVQVKDMFIDIGMSSEEEATTNGINIGSTGTLYDPIIEMPNNQLRARSLDDRLGCNLIIQLLKRLKNNSKSLEETILISFSVQEEVGLRGVGPATYTLDPTMALAIETTVGANVPNVQIRDRPTEVGKGPAISIIDRSTISSQAVNERITKNAELAQIKFQYKRPAFGGTNAGIIHKTKGGIPTTIISVPCKYLHSPVSMASMDDALALLNLLEAFLLNKAKIMI